MASEPPILCPACCYNVGGQENTICPECGGSFDADEIRERVGRRVKDARGLLLVGAGGYVVFAVNLWFTALTEDGSGLRDKAIAFVVSLITGVFVMVALRLILQSRVLFRLASPRSATKLQVVEGMCIIGLLVGIIGTFGIAARVFHMSLFS